MDCLIPRIDKFQSKNLLHHHADAIGEKALDVDNINPIFSREGDIYNNVVILL